MTAMWLCSSLIIWGLVPDLSFLHALAVGACVTPTDPVLSNSIVKGKFADKNIPKDLQEIIIAESGANDGLGYPFLFLALYLIKYTGNGGAGQAGGVRLAMAYWFGETWGYTIILSVGYGFAVGWIAKELLHFAEERKFVDRESFLVFAIALAVSPVNHVSRFQKLNIRFTAVRLRHLWYDWQRRCPGLLRCWERIYLGVSGCTSHALLISTDSLPTAIGSAWRLWMTLCSQPLICSLIYRSSCGSALCAPGPCSCTTM